MLIRAMYKVTGYLLVAAALSGFTPALYAGEPAPRFDWLIVGEPVHLDTSTRYLRSGLTRAGIRHAEKALRRADTDLHRLIANHNLCLGLAREGEIGAARPYCSALSRFSVPPLFLQPVKPGLYRVVAESGGRSDPDLRSVISGNLAVLNSIRGLSHLVKSDPAP